MLATIHAKARHTAMPTMGLSHLHVGSNSVSSPGRIRNADCLQLLDQVLCANLAPGLHATVSAEPDMHSGLCARICLAQAIIAAGALGRCEAALLA